MKRDQLTFWGSRNIVGSIPENTFLKKASFIWEIPAGTHLYTFFLDFGPAVKGGEKLYQQGGAKLYH